MVEYKKSFGYYIEKELCLNINDVWNWKKNKENGINSPYELPKYTDKYVWLYCLKKDYHNYDGQNNKIGYKVRCNNFTNGQRCSYCGSGKTHYKDSLGYLYPEIAQMIVNDERNCMTIEETYNMSPYTNKYYYFKCLSCGQQGAKKKSVNMVTGLKRYPCEYCSDGVSTPEKFMLNILKQLGINHIYQLNSSIFNWCKNYRYDFYIPGLNMIIETHGRQHYEETRRKQSLKEIQGNDKEKENLALINNIKEYVVINCRVVNFDWFKENFIKELSSYFDLSDINWELTWEESQNSLCVKTWKLWDKGLDVSSIAKEVNLNRHTVTRYLKRGEEINVICYSKEVSLERSYKNNSSYKKYNAKGVICLTTKELFLSMSDACRKYKLSSGTLSSHCNGHRNYCGKLPDGRILIWKKVVWRHDKKFRILED